MEARGQPGANADVILKILLPILVDTDKIPAKISLAASALLLELSKRPNNLCPLKHSEIAVFIQEVTFYNLPLVIVVKLEFFLLDSKTKVLIFGHYQHN